MIPTGPWPFILLGIVDRMILVHLFGSRYVSTDEAVQWHAAMDYSKGLFHGPFFYGQNYGPMLEALITAPFFRLGVPMYVLLPPSVHCWRCSPTGASRCGSNTKAN
ncbi:MAG: hypothetical protein IPF64_10360 [Flavobacteriales bacterium]|nr:hypothetical protein [Flavobacteriales bacterium]